MSRHHQQIKNDPRWKAARAATLDRDGHRCTWVAQGQRCTVTTGLQADHVLDLAAHPELAFEVENLRTYCHPHHVEAGRNKGERDIPRHEWINPKYRDALAIL